MGDEVRLWQVTGDDELREVSWGALDLESRLQKWLEADISLVDPGLLPIGREVATDFGGFIDILCVDAQGDLVIVELKRDRSPREVTAQGLDYASWVASLSHERLVSIGNEFFASRSGSDFVTEFRSKFGLDVPEALNADHRIVIVAADLDPSTERIIRYLSERGVNVNAARFQYFKAEDDSELLARVFLIEPSEIELNRVTSGSKRRPNPSHEELCATAVNAGVGELYDYAVKTFSETLQSATHLSGVTFSGALDRKRFAVLTLFLKDSSRGEGLRIRVYAKRYASLAGISVVSVGGLLPPGAEEWTGERNNPDTEYAGYQASITSFEQIDRLAAPLNNGRAAHAV